MIIIAGIFGAFSKWLFGSFIVFVILLGIAFKKNPEAVREWIKKMGEKK